MDVSKHVSKDHVMLKMLVKIVVLKMFNFNNSKNVVKDVMLKMLVK